MRTLAPGALLLVTLGCTSDSSDPKAAAARTATYVEDARCITCHEAEAASWKGSHHDLAMQEVSDETVRGDFDDAEFTHFGVTTRFFRRGQEFLVETEGPDGDAVEYPIRYVFGVEPCQQYLIEFPNGALQCLTTAWDTEAGRWYSLYPDERIHADDPFHWTGPYQRWNTMCAECHSTALAKHYNPQTRGYDTTFEELDVGCQACHGPGSGHLAWVEAGASEDDATYGLIRELARGEPDLQLAACAPCHSLRQVLDLQDEGGTLLDRILPSTLVAGQYHPDGQILGEVYVYGSFVQSKMYHQGVACTDCHDAHSTKLVFDNNALCGQCHTPQAPLERFPTLQQKDYDSREHHFHEPGSDAARCVSCHMSERTYMGVDGRRDHSFRIPRPDLSELLGVPNACNDCHDDRDAAWARERIDEWYGEREREPHYGQILAAGQYGDPRALPALATLALDAEEPAIVRASAIDLLAGFGAQAVPILTTLVADDEPFVRTAAVRGFGNLPFQQRVSPILGLLTDPVRSVRAEAARVLAPLKEHAVVPAAQLAQLDSALEEFERAQLYSADMPWAQLNLGRLNEDLGRDEAALAAYREALRIDPYFVDAALSQTLLLDELGRGAEGEEILLSALEVLPEHGELHYSLGLLLAGLDRLEDATASLARAARLMPDDPRARYNHGIALQQLERRDEALVELYEAYRLTPRDPEVVHALSIFHMQEEKWDLAKRFTEELIQLVPDERGPRETLEYVESKLRGE